MPSDTFVAFNAPLGLELCFKGDNDNDDDDDDEVGCINCWGNRTELADIVDVAAFEVQLFAVAPVRADRAGGWVLISGIVNAGDIMGGIACVLVLTVETEVDGAIDKFKFCVSPKTRSLIELRFIKVFNFRILLPTLLWLRSSSYKWRESSQFWRMLPFSQCACCLRRVSRCISY